ncbi:hypothetical protein TW81_01465 [Vibrio galatheae]|uniref:O-antigen ligase-related domain-containing protein n=1 Tax=Vibrio galatheae TaxID=579748 RepID=A0A0F4NPF1_9VIBR|nr:O-antigen ligase family protein [Vibrio galatheae]KJY85020.1 hypothetical protein TW81_01465 [Vibrio galatheae]
MNQTQNSYRVLLRVALLGLVFFSLNPFIARANSFLLYDSKRIFIILLMLASLVIAVVSTRTTNDFAQEFKLTSKHNRFFIALFVLFSAFATINASYPLAATLQFLYLIGLFVLTIQIKQVVNIEKVRVLQYFTWIGLMLFLCVAIVHWLSLSQGIPVQRHTLLGFTNARFLNQVHVWLVIPIAYLGLIQIRRQRSAFALRLLLAVCISVIVATDARGEAISVIAAFVLLIILDKANRKLWWSLCWQSVLVGTAVKILLLSPIPSLVLGIPAEWTTIRTDSSGRLQLWREAWEMATFSGLGADVFVCDSQTYGRPHNSLLNVLVHWGAITTLAYIGLCLSVVYRLVTVKRRLTRVFGVSLLSGLGYSLVSGVLDSPLSQLMAVLSIALYWASLTTTTPLSRTKPPYFLRLMTCLICISIALAISYRLFMRIHHYPVYDPNLVYKTQFWIGYNCLARPTLP